MGFPILVRQHLYIESGPKQQAITWASVTKICVVIWCRYATVCWIMWKKEDYTQLSFINVCMGLSCHLSFMQILRQASLFPVDNVIIDCVNDFEMVDVSMHSGSFDDVSYREQSCETHYPVSILRGWNKMALILQTTFWNSFSLMKIFTFWLKFYHGHLILNDKYIIPLKFHCPQTTYLRIVIYWL